MTTAGSWLSVELKKAVDADLAADLEKQGAYVSPEILQVRVEGGSVRCEVRAGADAKDVLPKLTRYVDLMVSKYRKLPRKVLHQSTRKDSAPFATGVYRELLSRGWVRELGRGQVALSGPALRAFRAVDNDCRDIGMNDFAAVEETYPTLIPSRTLARCGYFASFPQSVSLVTHLVEDIDAIEHFRQANAAGGDIHVPDARALTTPEACLSPAVCYHCYRSLEGQNLDGGPRIITTVGKCFRYESTNITGLDRLWDFTMREVIFVGTESEVTTRRQLGIERAKRQLEKWDLEASIETANDPFFSAAYATKTFHQVRGDLKFELRLAVEPGAAGEARSVACGSFNLHEDFFGRAFNVTSQEGAPAYTGCLAWGLERWVLALFTQHGFERSRWPEAVRDQIFG
jgi:seryl-tRNA synthetase